MRQFLVLISTIIFSQSTFAQGNKYVEGQKKMEWFDDAKLGIFIHWGVYSVDGIAESWSFYNNYISHENYLQQLQGFTAQNYEPKAWVDLIKNSGAKYAVITTKHHDGVALWGSRAEGALSIKKDAAVKKDVLTPFVDALQKSGLKTGLYFSLPDWSYVNYNNKTKTQQRYTLQNEPERWQKFIHYYQEQLTELSKAYHPDLLWFDGDWEHSAEEWKAEETLKLLRGYNSNLIVNSRLNQHGDYATPEQGIPVKKPQQRYWELCYTMNDSWGYQPFDKHYKSPNMIVRTLIECLSMGGNLLLDIGPKADGTIPEEQVNVLKELARWTHKYSEAIYGTKAGVNQSYVNEKNAWSKDGKTLFIYLDQVKNYLEINGLATKPSEIRLLSSTTKIPFTYKNSKLTLEIPTQNFDETATVIAIKFRQKPSFLLTVAEEKTDIQQVLRNKNAPDAIRTIVKATSMGGNIFNGKINDDASEINASLDFASKEVRSWVKKHAELLYDAHAGIAPDHFNGKTALSKDRQTLYLFVEGKPTGPIAIKGLKNNIARIRIVGDGSVLGYHIFNKLYWSATPGIVYIDIPKERLDTFTTVIAILLDKPIELYAEEVKAIESNL